MSCRAAARHRGRFWTTCCRQDIHPVQPVLGIPATMNTGNPLALTLNFTSNTGLVHQQPGGPGKVEWTNSGHAYFSFLMLKAGKVS